ncbi:MAG: hypothetical protein ACYTG1_07260 [Planctomycetota bacterium]|jgi:hypothetical protein
MVSPETRKRLGSLAMFVVPVLLVKAAGVLLGGGGPVGAEAAAVPDAIPPVVLPEAAPASWTPEQEAAAAHVTGLAGRAFGPTPMYYEPRVAVHADDPPPVTPVTPVASVDGPAVQVTAIVETDREAQAFIGGRWRRVGDRLPGGEWEITGIDCARRTVTVAHPSGRTDVLSVPAP